MISVIKNIQMLFHDISQPFNDRTEGNNHQHGDNAEFSAEQNGDRGDNEVVDDADHTERNVRQVGGDNEGYCVVRCSSHINIHIEGCGKDKQDQRGSLTVEYKKKCLQALWYLLFLCQIFCFILWYYLALF